MRSHIEPASHPRKLASELGLTTAEYDRIEATLGRVPSTAELGSFSVMWSEHCSYKSSRVHLQRLPTDGEHLLAGQGDNAGVVDVGGGRAVAFKIESHNHPSFVEPFQGAATGVGGIVRDILTMGARPIALLDPLRFGDPATPPSRWVVDGVVRGIGHYGNSIGVPTVGGEVVFDPCYQGNPLVNVLCVGVLPADRVQRARAEHVGDVAVLIGQRTGRDGIGGASVLASADFSSAGDDAKRPNVQVGDPFAGNTLIECCLELYERDLLRGIQDMGAAGIVCSSAEMAAAAGLGMRIDLDLVPLREPSMQAWEILCSESQERMLALVAPQQVDAVVGTCARWGVDATPIGAVTDDDRLVFTRGGAVVHDAPARALADEGPVYERPVVVWEHPLADEDVDALPEPDDLHAAALAVLTSPNIAPPEWVTHQYDSVVGSGTVQGPGGSAAVLRLPPAAGWGATPSDPRGVAVATDGNGRWCALDPELGAQLVVAEAARNVACTGARPVAATNCLNFGSPERPEVMGAFSATVDGMAAACLALGTPISGGNVSFYNATDDQAIHPTPVVGVLGVIDDCATAVPVTPRATGTVMCLIGAATRPGLGGSEYLWRTAGRIAGRPPAIDLDEERRLQNVLVAAAGDGLLRSAHDVATGGLITTLVEVCGDRWGADITADPTLPLHQWLFSESPSRAVVSVAADAVVELETRCADADLRCTRLGEATGVRSLRVGDALDLDLVTLAVARQRVFDDLFEADEQAAAAP
ncbi:MAG: phosphoribosylformylglycinamidine synthase subunit PurL [Actinobacteria bacterium]|nr:phosphoribosylformylglycinamidine synthase subunit PurL [Actinomycetota bacterium]